MKKSRIFLGGTIGDTTWREKLIELLDTDNYFNPVVADWTAEAQRKEEQEKNRCAYCLYVITPKMTGLFTVAELVDGSNKKPANTIACFLKSDDESVFDESQWRSIMAIVKLLRQNGTQCFFSLESVASYFNS